jgi:NAD(P)-dependent dehydrogenase (short-subunit alcohol dehydrogenase family)
MEKSVVLITGGATRLARNIAISLAKNNYLVIVHYNKSEEEALSLKEEMGDTCKLIQYDFFSHETKEFFNRAIELFGRIDFIINAASIFMKHEIQEIDEELLEKYNLIHSITPLLLSTSLYEHLQSRNKTGAVINITDASLKLPSKKRVPYFLSKESLSFQTRLLAAEFTPVLRVNEIAPGLIMASENDESYFEKMKKKNKMGIGTDYDIIGSILYLLQANYVTGETLSIDGGLFF